MVEDADAEGDAAHAVVAAVVVAVDGVIGEGAINYTGCAATSSGGQYFAISGHSTTCHCKSVLGFM